MERRQQQRVATQQRIFETAVALFLEHGYHETTVDAICAAAGVAKGTFFVHFATKSAVLDHLGQLQLAQIQHVIDEEPGFYDQPFVAQIRAIYSALGAGLSEQRALVLLISIESLSRSGTARGTVGGVPELDALLRELVERAQARGDVRPNLAPDEVARAVRNLHFAAVFDWLRSDTASYTSFVYDALDLLLYGVSAVPQQAVRSAESETA